MKRTGDSERDLTPEDRQLIERIDAAFRPAAMSAARRVAFRAALDERIERRNPARRWLAPALATTAAAAAALWFSQPEPAAPSLAAAESSELYAFIDPDAVSGELSESPSYLPDDYLALALLIESDDPTP